MDTFGRASRNELSQNHTKRSKIPLENTAEQVKRNEKWARKKWEKRYGDQSPGGGNKRTTNSQKKNWEEKERGDPATKKKATLQNNRGNWKGPHDHRTYAWGGEKENTGGGAEISSGRLHEIREGGNTG